SALHPGAVPCARPLRDALRVLATVRYNPASSYPSSEEAKRSLLAWMACKRRQRSADGGVLLSRGSGVRFPPGAPFFSGNCALSDFSAIRSVPVLVPVALLDCGLASRSTVVRAQVGIALHHDLSLPASCPPKRVEIHSGHSQPRPERVPKIMV